MGAIRLPDWTRVSSLPHLPLLSPTASVSSRARRVCATVRTTSGRLRSTTHERLSRIQHLGGFRRLGPKSSHADGAVALPSGGTSQPELCADAAWLLRLVLSRDSPGCSRRRLRRSGWVDAAVCGYRSPDGVQPAFLTNAIETAPARERVRLDLAAVSGVSLGESAGARTSSNRVRQSPDIWARRTGPVCVAGATRPCGGDPHADALVCRGADRSGDPPAAQPGAQRGARVRAGVGRAAVAGSPRRRCPPVLVGLNR